MGALFLFPYATAAEMPGKERSKMLIHKSLFSRFAFMLFDADGGGNAGGGSGNGSGDDPNNKSGGEGNKGGAGDGEKKVTHTQAELDAQFAERAKRGGEAAIEKLLKEIGAESPDALKEAMKKLKTIDDANKTESQKQADAIAALTKERDEAKKAADEKMAKADQKLMKAEVKAEAINQKVRPDAVDDVFMFVDQTKIKIKDDGSFEGVKAAVEAVIKAKPYLLNTGKVFGNGTPRSDKNESGNSENNNLLQPKKRFTL